MAKRFIATELWNEDWFLDMKIEYKLFWYYIISNCNHAGIFKLNLRTFNLLNEVNLTSKQALDYFNNGKVRIRELSDSKWFIEDFFVFQYGSKFNTNNRVHESIGKELIKNNIILTSIRGLIDHNDSVKDKDKDKDKVLVVSDNNLKEKKEKRKNEEIPIEIDIPISEQTIRKQYDKFITTDSVQKDQMAMNNNLTKRQVDISCIGFVSSLLEAGELQMNSIYPKFGYHFRNWFNSFGKNNISLVPKAKIEVEFKKFKIHEFKEKELI